MEYDKDKAGGLENSPLLPPRQSPEEAAARKAGFYREVFDWMESLVSAVVITVLLFCFVGRVATVSGASMVPTLHDGDVVLLSDLFYTPAYGDVVIVTQPDYPQEPLVKRVIATQGQTVDIDFDRGQVWVDGRLLEEPYINEPTHRSFDLGFPQTIPQGHVFVMGDNRNNSMDSRSGRVGMIDTRNILGKVRMRVLPPSDLGKIQ